MTLPERVAVEVTQLSRGERRTLRRIAANKSLHDFDALDKLVQRGFVTERWEDSSNGFIEITVNGQAALAALAAKE